MVAAVEAFVLELPVACPVRDVLKRIQYIGEGVGYAIAVRDSKHRGQAGRRVSNLNPIECDLLLCKTHKGRGCCFRMTVMTREKYSLGTNGSLKNGKLRYFCDMVRAFHYHEPDKRSFIKYLPPETTEQALCMHNDLKMTYIDVVIYLEDKHGIKIDREVL